VTAIFAVALEEVEELAGLDEPVPVLGPAELALAAAFSSFFFFSLRQSAFLCPLFLQ
jgi:hypothetical protein